MTDRYRAGGHRPVHRSRSSGGFRANWRVWVSGAFLTAAIVFGGGGTPSPSTELVVELVALAALALWSWLAARDRSYRPGPIDRPLLILAALFVAIPVLQLIPLPPAIWHHLPGRAVEIQALALVGRVDAWMPLSESPPRTLASALSLIPPIAMLFMVSRLRDRDRVTLIGVLAVLGIVAAVVGVLQLASGNANWFRFYDITQYGFATGFQANRNADADLLLIAAMAAAAWAVTGGRLRHSRQVQLLLAAGFLFLVLSVVLTGSRAGVALILVAVLAVLAMFVRKTALNWKVVGAAVLGLVAIGMSAYLLSGNARIGRTIVRFDIGGGVRPEIWKDSVYAIGEHWPAGSGVGTFQPIFAAAERLEFVRQHFANRAHNDYLEFALEAGIIAPLFLLAVLVFAGVRLRRILVGPDAPERRASGIFVLGAILVLVLHSVVDYPMRTLSLAVVSGMLAGLLGRSCAGGEERRRRSSEGVSE